MKHLRRTSCLGLLGLLLTSCGSSGSDTTQGGSGTGPFVEFVSTADSVLEGGGPVVIGVTLSAAQAGDVTVTFAVSGTATDGDDYSIDPGSLLILAGDVEGSITLTPVVDQVCEPTETVIVTLVSATGVALGADRVHTTRVSDDDAELVLESEPNDAVVTADAAGGMLVGRCVEIQGNIQEGMPDPFDVFEFTAEAPVDVRVDLRPGSDQMDLVLFVTDASGAVIEVIQDGGVGEAELRSFTIDSSLYPEFNLAISSFGPPGDYGMSVSGSSPSPGLAAGAPRDVDWDELKESLRRGGAVAERSSPMQLIGIGVLLNTASGEARQVALGALIDG